MAYWFGPEDVLKILTLPGIVSPRFRSTEAVSIDGLGDIEIMDDVGREAMDVEIIVVVAATIFDEIALSGNAALEIGGVTLESAITSAASFASPP